MEYKYFAFIGCLLLFAFLAYKEFLRADKARLSWRIMVSFFMVLCFLLLLVPITYQTQHRQSTGEINLITAGTHPDTIAQLKGNYGALATANLRNNKAKSITDLPYFLKSNPQIKKLTIYGYGLNENELRLLKDHEVVFHPTKNFSGIISASWQHQLKVSEPLLVQGTYQNKEEKTVKLLLKGFGTDIDSIIVEANTNKSFSFKIQPKQIGKAIFQLIAFQKRDTISIDPVPFEVSEQEPIKVLMLSSFPDFEYKFLKKWLFENQYPLAFRSQISKNKYTTDFLNLERFNLERVNISTLKKFDLLLIDEEELLAISETERTAIATAVQQGMGLLIRISNPKIAKAFGYNFLRYEAAPAKNKQLNVQLLSSNLKLHELPIEQVLYLKVKQGDQPLVVDAGGKILANSTLIGNGKIIATTIGATYQWLLAGKKTDYTNYWSEILVKGAKKKQELYNSYVAPQFPTLYQKTNIKVDVNDPNKVPLLKIDSVNLSPRQNMELPFKWDATFWPQHTGWHDAKINDYTSSFYVFKKLDWKAAKIQQTIDATLHFSKNYHYKRGKDEIESINIDKEVSKWWFLIGFLIASAFLWYESRILASR
jgi:hypothetical protein